MLKNYSVSTYPANSSKLLLGTQLNSALVTYQDRGKKKICRIEGGGVVKLVLKSVSMQTDAEIKRVYSDNRRTLQEENSKPSSSCCNSAEFTHIRQWLGAHYVPPGSYTSDRIIDDLSRYRELLKVYGYRSLSASTLSPPLFNFISTHN